MHRITPILVAVSLLAGCGDSTGSGNGAGSVSFTYTGTVSGTFSAVGPPPPPATADEGTWGRRPVVGLVKIGAQVPTQGGGLGDIFFMNVHILQSGPQTVVVNDTVCPPAPCANGFIGLGLYLTPPLILSQGYSLTSGEVRLIELSATRLRGTFHGTATKGSSVIQVENGTFDVPVSQ